MNRYLLEVYSDEYLIFCMEFRSITNVAKTIDKFFNTEILNIWFRLDDMLKDRSIDTDELMRIWHS